MPQLTAPRLAVYTNGTTIADASHTAHLDSATLTTLLDKLAADLRDPAAGRKRPGIVISDAQVTQLQVRAPAGTYAITADGVDELRDEHAYPSMLYDARDRLDVVYQNAIKGARYTATRVRLATADAITTGDPAAPWPSRLPVPAASGPGPTVTDLDGADAATVVASIKSDTTGRGEWGSYRTGDGRVLRAAWRYLLPDE